MTVEEEIRKKQYEYYNVNHKEADTLYLSESAKKRLIKELLETSIMYTEGESLSDGFGMNVVLIPGKKEIVEVGISGRKK